MYLWSACFAWFPERDWSEQTFSLTGLSSIPGWPMVLSFVSKENFLILGQEIPRSSRVPSTNFWPVLVKVANFLHISLAIIWIKQKVEVDPKAKESTSSIRTRPRDRKKQWETAREGQFLFVVPSVTDQKGFRRSLFTPRRPLEEKVPTLLGGRFRNQILDWCHLNSLVSFKSNPKHCQSVRKLQALKVGSPILFLCRV